MRHNADAIADAAAVRLARNPGSGELRDNFERWLDARRRDEQVELLSLQC